MGSSGSPRGLGAGSGAVTLALVAANALVFAVMVARGDLGVEMPAEDVPGLQKRIIAACRLAGKPVVVATQMLDSMVTAPTPTRAEASDVATAVYDGADAVMLSAETASGAYPLESVSMMNRIAERVERDPFYRRILEAQRLDHYATESDAISQAAAQVAHTLSAAAICTYTTSGSTGLRMARRQRAATASSEPYTTRSPSSRCSRQASASRTRTARVRSLLGMASLCDAGHGYLAARWRLASSSTWVAASSVA